MKKLAIVGAGSWGTALSIALGPRFGQISLWSHDPELARQMRSLRENRAYLPGAALPAVVEPEEDLGPALAGAVAVLFVVPSQYLRAVVRQAGPFIPRGVALVSATKGIEASTLCRMSQVLREELSNRFEPDIAVLSGPTFAKEVAGGEPAALVVASTDAQLGARVQSDFSGPSFRLYTNPDPAGVEIGASLKNVIAIGAGICQGLGLGGNATAALVTRGLAEITRLAVACGGQAKTLAGLAGLGDLVLTCTGDLSRNRRVGIELARGRHLVEILA
ncbi:MAG TPA: NAD(P)H-dependent glycerol-3-phosphate dehydrogenase, partial [Bryobacteraceae bacterium]|nr:NAD(P)H-dependent glycerol-3-phosphate dehydrogenase [Bryobacteraceae bacterium]